MPEVVVDDRNWLLYRQCEIRRPSGRDATSYFFHIVWIDADDAKKGATIEGAGATWTIAEVWGVKKMPSPRRI